MYSMCVITDAIQGLIPLDDAILKQENRADEICLAEEIPNLIRDGGATPILCLKCLDLREIYSIQQMYNKYVLKLSGSEKGCRS